jgi:hypothetical protein
VRFPRKKGTYKNYPRGDKAEKKKLLHGSTPSTLCKISGTKKWTFAQKKKVRGEYFLISF